MPAHRYVVVALFDPISVGTVLSRRRWPAHVTLVSNFTTEASVDLLHDTVRAAIAGAALAADTGATVDSAATPDAATTAGTTATADEASLLDATVLDIELGDLALFGPDRDIPVRLVVTPRIADLHIGLIDRLEAAAGIIPDVAGYWRSGYRPHLTLTPTISAAAGDRLRARSIAIARLDGDTAIIVSASDTARAESNPEIEVRRATPADLPGLARLKIEWARLDDAPPADEVVAFADDLGAWNARQGDGLVVEVAVADGAVVGMAWMVIFERVPDFSDRHRLTADIQSVFVAPAHRDRGVGCRLVDELCREADRRGIPRTLVSANERALGLYRRSGFAPSPVLLQRVRGGES
ncbi:ribosomal protein S18 acetylase RimI-like enzyme [Microbacterium terrae]|uniref:Acetyltransferase (GNAT) family protein n=1 Tax=Microbacterium terrae TaxID=69369 RepID=A0A0M2H385_9MICO|nr:GNAT family N-acetyltransferase [Microbacterium terrae]KJL38763.1 Acetyltransferase (GNAT) family protein [Microbacterium terrae]MBP1076182.1 ribosomal protein S18 acetylase RimI-like enzyme [Microbacterium terrae]GLJ97002.1 hypothetical protein GCM10017594_01990 [Microbacterium terrae]